MAKGHQVGCGEASLLPGLAPDSVTSALSLSFPSLSNEGVAPSTQSEGPLGIRYPAEGLPDVGAGEWWQLGQWQLFLLLVSRMPCGCSGPRSKSTFLLRLAIMLPK